MINETVKNTNKMVGLKTLTLVILIVIVITKVKVKYRFKGINTLVNVT